MASKNDQTDFNNKYKQALWEYNYAIGQLHDESTPGYLKEIEFLKKRVEYIKNMNWNK